MILIRSTKSGYIADVDIDGKIFRSEFGDVVAAAEWARELMRMAKTSYSGIIPRHPLAVPLTLDEYERSVKDEKGNSGVSVNTYCDSDCGK